MNPKAPIKKLIETSEIKKLIEISKSGRTVEMVLNNSRGSTSFHSTVINHKITKQGLIKFYMLKDIPFKTSDIQHLSVMTTVIDKNRRNIVIFGRDFIEFFSNDKDFNSNTSASQLGFKQLGLKSFKDLKDFCDKQGTDSLGSMQRETIHCDTFPEIYLANGGAK